MILCPGSTHALTPQSNFSLTHKAEWWEGVGTGKVGTTGNLKLNNQIIKNVTSCFKREKWGKKHE